MKKGEFIPTTRPNGASVGQEVSRQRRHQIRNIEATREKNRAYLKTEKGKAKRQRYYQKKQAQKSILA